MAQLYFLSLDFNADLDASALQQGGERMSVKVRHRRAMNEGSYGIDFTVRNLASFP